MAVKNSDAIRGDAVCNSASAHKSEGAVAVDRSANGKGGVQECEALVELISADNPDPDDPRWTRIAELSASQDDQLLKPRATPSRRRLGQALFDHGARRFAGLDQLADLEPDTMALHTRDAMRAFTGRRADPAARHAFIPGGQRYAATLKVIWFLSANDNPYADWTLIRTYDALKALRNEVTEASQARLAAVEALKSRGLSVSIMSAPNPRIVSLKFRSPYGYATAELIVEFDYFARVVKTLIHKDRLSDTEGHAAIYELERKMRTLFHAPIQWERRLLSEDLLPLRREDFLPGADEAARTRARAAIEAFGEVPPRVLVGLELPRHTLRRVRFNQEQLRLLKEVQSGAGQGAATRDAELL